MNARAPGRIGPWRLLDIVLATMPLRASMMGAGALPEYGQADAKVVAVDPEEELPDSNISETEQRQAIQRERSRRWFVARG